MADAAGKHEEIPMEADDLSDFFLEEQYNMKNKRRGLALIFNHFKFKDSDLPDRKGTDVDCSKLKESLKDLDFEVNVHNDKPKKEVEEIISEAAKADHSDADCFLLAFLSHGEGDYVYTHDKKICIRDITDYFKGNECESLVGKPKIFIWQACRGRDYDQPVAVCMDDEANDTPLTMGVMKTLPAGADFLMCYSVAEGFVSFRNENNGSWYIQDLCELLQSHGESLEFTHLLTLVNRKVSMRSVKKHKYEKATGKKQIPCFASMLTKKLYFHKKQ